MKMKTVVGGMGNRVGLNLFFVMNFLFKRVRMQLKIEFKWYLLLLFYSMFHLKGLIKNM